MLQNRNHKPEFRVKGKIHSIQFYGVLLSMPGNKHLRTERESYL